MSKKITQHSNSSVFISVCSVNKRGKIMEFFQTTWELLSFLNSDISLMAHFGIIRHFISNNYLELFWCELYFLYVTGLERLPWVNKLQKYWVWKWAFALSQTDTKSWHWCIAENQTILQVCHSTRRLTIYLHLHHRQLCFSLLYEVDVYWHQQKFKSFFIVVLLNKDTPKNPIFTEI